MASLATLADVKLALHRDANDTSIDDALAAALQVAQDHVTRYIKQDFRQRQTNTWTIYDRPEDAIIPLPVEGATVNQIRFYRTPSATAYVGRPMVDYEVDHDGLEAPVSFNAQAHGAGTLAAGTYFWVATAGNALGETNPSVEVAATVPANSAVQLTGQLYGGEQWVRFYRVTAQGTETSNSTCLVAQLAVTNLPIQPGTSSGPLSFSYTDQGNATGVGTAPNNNGTITIPARKIRLHPTYFDVPFEGAVSMHMPDNWSRIEVDYTPPQQVPAAIRLGTALTAAAIYARGPLSASGYTMERLGDYSWTVRNYRGTGSGANEVIPEVAKAVLRPYRRRGGITTT